VPINMADQPLIRPVLQDFAEAVQSPAIFDGELTCDLEAGNVAEVTLTANVTSMAILNPAPAGLACILTAILRQDGAGGRTVIWPAGVTWLAGSAPTMPAASNAVLVASFLTTDGGTSWLGFWR
jgi:hypothetical protein